MSRIVFPTAPGVAVNVSTTAGGAGNPAPNATAFVVGTADRGPAVPTQVLDFLDFQTKYGARSTTSLLLSDSVEEIFGEGGFTVYVCRVLGTTPVLGTLTLSDRAGSPLPTMRLDAAFYGAQSANITVSVTASANGIVNTFDVNIFDSTSSSPNAAVEIFRDNPDVATAVAAINAGSSLVVATNLASSSSGLQAQPAVIAATALSAGTDDHGTANDTTWSAAINAFDPNLGPGLLLAPGRTTPAVHASLQTSAIAAGRFALLDPADQASASTVLAMAVTDSSVAGLNKPGDSALLVAPWVTIPPAPGGANVRSVPGSAFVAGLLARVDAQVGHSNQAPMGINGDAQYAVGISGVGFTEAERASLNGRQGSTGVSVIRSTPTIPCQLYGFRTLTTDSGGGYYAANVRETLAIRYQIELVGDSFVGRQIDGRGHVFSDLSNQVSSVLLDAWNRDALYGATAADAFGVDAGPTVNTTQTIAQGLIRCRVSFTPSPTGERVIFDLVRTGVR